MCFLNSLCQSCNDPELLLLKLLTGINEPRNYNNHNERNTRARIVISGKLLTKPLVQSPVLGWGVGRGSRKKMYRFEESTV